MFVVERIRKLLADNRYEGSMIKVTDGVILRPGNFRSAMKGDRYMNWSLVPSGVFVKPISSLSFCISIKIILSQYGINLVPFLMSHVLRLKVWVPNNVYKLCKALSRFLVTVIPIPVTKKKRTLVWVWME